MPAAYRHLFVTKRYKGLRGGRGAGRSWLAATALIAHARTSCERVLCTREYQTTIRESVHHLLRARIEGLGLAKEFDITDISIRHLRSKSEFIFKGLRYDPQGIKSLEGITKVWIEEARTVSRESLIILDPTLRNSSEIWATWNPEDSEDAIEAFFADKDETDKVVVTTTWRDNPFFPEDLQKLRAHDEALAKATGDWDAYNWVWEGQFRKISEAAVFRRRVVVEAFETPPGARFFHGADWGFANDPTALIRCYMSGEPDGKHLWIDEEIFGFGVDIDETPALFGRIPTSRAWPIKADCSRPETINYIKRAGFNIVGADKWSGSVEDGIAYLKGFVCIHIHDRCKNMIEEAKLYSYKKDRLTDEVLPVLVDAHNHGWDAVRYALGDYIKAKGRVIVSAAALARAQQPSGVGFMPSNPGAPSSSGGLGISDAALERMNNLQRGW